MSSQIDSIIAKAKRYIGVKESPANSNNVIFNTAYYGRAVSGAAYPWCCVFVWYVFSGAGLSPLFHGGGKTASCTVLMNYAKSHGQWVTSGYKPGDILLMNFSGGKTVAEHVGIVTAVNSGSVTTVEGNTSLTSNDNGGAVMERIRSGSVILGAYRPAYAADKPAEQPKREDEDMVERYNTLSEMPAWARATIKKLVDIGAIKGNGAAKDQNGVPTDMDFSEDMLRELVINDRAGLYK